MRLFPNHQICGQCGRPKAADLYCGGGGAAQGMMGAGLCVSGVDIKDHSRAYPGAFHQGDALDPPFDLTTFAII